MADNSQLMLKAGLDVTNFLAEAKKLEGFADKIQGRLESAAKRSAVAFAGLSAAVTLSVKASSDFDATFSDAVTQLDRSGKSVQEFNKEVETLRKGVLELSRSSGQNFTDLNKALYELISSGVKAGDALKVLGVGAQLATAGATDVASATKALIAAQTSFGDRAGSAIEIAQKFNEANRYGITTVGELANQFNTVAGSAASLGFSFDETLSAAAALTRDGATPTGEAFTKLSGIFTELLQASTAAARGQDVLQEKFHFTEEITKKLMPILSANNIEQKGFVKVIREVSAAVGGNDAALNTLFGRVEGFRGVLALTTTQAKSYDEILNAVSNTTQSAANFQNALEIKYGTTAFKTAQLVQSIQAFRVELGDQLAPILVPLIEKFTELVNKFGELDPKVKSTIAQVLLAATAITGFGAASFGASSAIISVIQAFGGVAATLSTIAGIIGGVPLLIGGAVAAVTALLAAIFGFGDKISSGLQSILDKSGQVTEYLRANFGVVGEILASGIELFVSFNQEAVIPTIQWLYTLGQSFAEFFSWLNSNQALLISVKGYFIILKEAIATLASFSSVAFKSFQLAIGEGMLAVVSIMQKGVEAINAFRAAFGLAPIATDFSSMVSSIAQTNSQLIASIKATTAAAIERNLALSGQLTSLRNGPATGAVGGMSQGLADAGAVPTGPQQPIGPNIPADQSTPGASDTGAANDNSLFAGGAGGAGGVKTFDERMAELNKQWQTEEQAHQEHLLKLRDQEVKSHNERLAAYETFGKGLGDMVLFFQSKEYEATSNFLGELASLQNSSNKQLAAIGKAAAIAKMVVDIPRTAFKAYAGMVESIPGPGGIAAGVAAAASSTALGLARLADIKKAKTAAQGGLVTGGIPGQDSVPIMAMRGEVIIPKKAAESLQPNFEQYVMSRRGMSATSSNNEISETPQIEIAWRNGADKYITAQIVRNRELGIDTRV